MGSTIFPDSISKTKKSNPNQIRQSTPNFAVEGKNSVNKKIKNNGDESPSGSYLSGGNSPKSR